MVQITIPASRFTPALAQGPPNLQESFVQRLLEFEITLGPGGSGVFGTPQPSTFAGTSGANNVTLAGNRARVRVQTAASIYAQAQVDVYGLTPSLLNDLSQLGMTFNQVRFNTMSINAGDEINGFSKVFTGSVTSAWPDYNQAPEVPMRFICQTAAFPAVQATKPISYSGGTDVATIMQTLAGQLNLVPGQQGIAFENNGITAQLQSPYYGGNVWTQIQRVAHDANINAAIVDGGTKLAIWPVGGARQGGKVPLISPQTGMKGYPSFGPNYMKVEMIYNPDVGRGSTIQVESAIPTANGKWNVFKLDLVLDSLVPKGNWLGIAYCLPVNFGGQPPVVL